MAKKYAYLFPGQGAQAPGMVKDLAEAFPTAKKVIDDVSSITGLDMGKLLWESDAEADILLYTGDSMRVSVSGGTKWKSSDKSVVTVNSQGKVVAVGAGTAILKSNKGKTLTVMVEGDDDDWDDEDW